MNIRRIYRGFKKYFRNTGIVIMYHRIATPEVDPWQLAVSPENFEQHLQILKKSYYVVPLSQFVQQIRNKSLKNRRIAITFDDGYEDNYLTAMPLLEKYELPATFFLASGNMGIQKEFWWDELEKIILQTPILPQHLQLEINRQPIIHDLGNETTLTDDLRIKHRYFVGFGPTSLRSALYLRIWELLSTLVAQDQERIMGQLRDWAGTTSKARSAYCCMSSAQASALSAKALFNLGGHTVTHPALDYQTKELQQKEINRNKIFLENLSEKSISMFAYPSGKYNEITMEVLREQNFEAGFTTNFGGISKNHDLYRLNRIQINNWDGKYFKGFISTCF